MSQLWKTHKFICIGQNYYW